MRILVHTLPFFINQAVRKQKNIHSHFLCHHILPHLFTRWAFLYFLIIADLVLKINCLFPVIKTYFLRQKRKKGAGLISVLPPFIMALHPLRPQQSPALSFSKHQVAQAPAQFASRNFFPVLPQVPHNPPQVPWIQRMHPQEYS